MNSKIKVIISPSYGDFEPNRLFLKRLKDCGYEKWESIDARTDPKIIEFVEKQIEKSKLDFNMAFVGKSKDQFLIITSVSTEHPWSISQYKGSEFIRYFNYEVIDKNLNYCNEINP